MLIWTNDLSGCPSQSWAFVLASERPYALFLTWRPGRESWRAFVIPNARRESDLFGDTVQWSRDVFEESGVAFGEAQVREAQQALVRLLAGRLGVSETLIVAARNGYAIKQAAPRLSGAQLHQIARVQPRRK